LSQRESIRRERKGRFQPLLSFSPPTPGLKGCQPLQTLSIRCVPTGVTAENRGEPREKEKTPPFSDSCVLILLIWGLHTTCRGAQIFICLPFDLDPDTNKECRVRDLWSSERCRVCLFHAAEITHARAAVSGAGRLPLLVGVNCG